MSETSTDINMDIIDIKGKINPKSETKKVLILIII